MNTKSSKREALRKLLHLSSSADDSGSSSRPSVLQSSQHPEVGLSVNQDHLTHDTTDKVSSLSNKAHPGESIDHSVTEDGADEGLPPYSPPDVAIQNVDSKSSKPPDEKGKSTWSEEKTSKFDTAISGFSECEKSQIVNSDKKKPDLDVSTVKASPPVKLNQHTLNTLRYRELLRKTRADTDSWSFRCLIDELQAGERQSSLMPGDGGDSTKKSSISDRCTSVSQLCGSTAGGLPAAHLETKPGQSNEKTSIDDKIMLSVKAEMRDMTAKQKSLATFEAMFGSSNRIPVDLLKGYFPRSEEISAFPAFMHSDLRALWRDRLEVYDHVDDGKDNYRSTFDMPPDVRKHQRFAKINAPGYLLPSSTTRDPAKYPYLAKANVDSEADDIKLFVSGTISRRNIQSFREAMEAEDAESYKGKNSDGTQFAANYAFFKKHHYATDMPKFGREGLSPDLALLPVSIRNSLIDQVYRCDTADPEEFDKHDTYTRCSHLAKLVSDRMELEKELESARERERERERERQRSNDGRSGRYGRGFEIKKGRW